MMRGPKAVSMATRLPDGTIDVEMIPGAVKQRSKLLKLPIIRGCVNFVDSLRVGYKCMMKSAEKAGIDEEEAEPSKFEQWLDRVFSDKFANVLMGAASVLGVVLAVFLFIYLPALAVKGLSMLVNLGWTKSLIEGLIKIVIFILYLAAVSRMEEIHTTFCYHGAEHKTIACYEAGEPLTVENIRRQIRFHPRCGTSFILIVLIIGILVFSMPIIPWDNILLRSGIKILLMPVVVGVAYELIKLAGRYDNPVTKIISAPGLWLQRLTTNEPNDSQIEVAIAAMERVIPQEKGLDRW
ncbi:MAG TPA: DUF1385 domain-containing protein [Firmicutes bacterium]|nr:DUF1385 domain-containing protein [Bacillota bacterium]